MSEGLDIDFVSGVLKQLLIDAGRPIILEDNANGAAVEIPLDSAGAADGLLPAFLFVGEALWRDATGDGFGLAIERDIGALLSWRVKKIGVRQFTSLLLSVMEAIAEAATPDGVMVLELARVFDEAMDRVRSREQTI